MAATDPRNWWILEAGIHGVDEDLAAEAHTVFIDAVDAIGFTWEDSHVSASDTTRGLDAWIVVDESEASPAQRAALAKLYITVVSLALSKAGVSESAFTAFSSWSKD